MTRPAVLRAGTLVLLFGLLAWNFLAAEPAPAELYHSVADECLLFPLALESSDPSLYPSDPWIPLAEAVFSTVYSRLMGPLLVTSTDPLRIAWWVSLVPYLLFFAGTVVLTRAMTGDLLPGALCGGLLLLPVFRQFGVGPGSVLPRDFLFAFAPWLLLTFSGSVGPALRRMGVGGLALGLLANLHPLTALHLSLVVLLAAFFMRPGRRGLLAATVFGLGFAAGAAPYVIRYLGLPRAGPPSVEVMKLRVADLLGLAPEVVLRTMGTPLLLVGVLAIARFPGLRTKRRFVSLVLAAGFWVLIGAVAPRFVPYLGQFQFGRLMNLVGFLSLLATAAALVDLPRRFGTRRAVLLAGLVLVLVTVPQQRRLLHRAGRFLAGHPPPSPRTAPPRERMGELTRASPTARRQYLSLCGWVREETPKEALFLVPPEHFSHFRLYGRRSILVDRKAGGFLASFLGRRAVEWMECYRKVVGLYAEANAEKFAAFARERNVDYILAVLPAEQLDLPVVHREGRFVVYGVPR